MGDDRRASNDRVEPDTFLDRVNRLARQPARQADFHRTRPPFTRLTDVVGRMRAGSEARHPTHCQASACGAALTDGYYRRADGLTLCQTCFHAVGARDACSSPEP